MIPIDASVPSLGKVLCSSAEKKQAQAGKATCTCLGKENTVGALHELQAEGLAHQFMQCTIYNALSSSLLIAIVVE